LETLEGNVKNYRRFKGTVREDVGWIRVTSYRICLGSLLNTILKFWPPKNGEFLHQLSEYHFQNSYSSMWSW
jgi:predicted metal-dependent HD superfamily phosphohydrolase